MSVQGKKRDHPGDLSDYKRYCTGRHFPKYHYSRLVIMLMVVRVNQRTDPEQICSFSSFSSKKKYVEMKASEKAQMTFIKTTTVESERY